MTIYQRRCVALAALLFVAPCLAAQEGTARDLVARVLARDLWDDLQGEITLVLTSANGQQKVRGVQLWSKKSADKEMRLLMRFESPADVRGTGMLVIEHARAEDDRRLFLPALRRVQRISTSGRGGYFMASDFTYYDIGRPKLDDWEYQAAGEQTAGASACMLIKATAANEQIRSETGYARIDWCVDPRRMLILSADYYDKAGDALKTMTVEKIEDVAGAPFATHLSMRNVRTGHRSELRFGSLVANQGISDETFTERSLLRWTQ